MGRGEKDAERRRRMCTSKKRYPTELKAIKHACGSSYNTGDPLRWYRCPYCMGYHLTSKIGHVPPEGR